MIVDDGGDDDDDADDDRELRQRSEHEDLPEGVGVGPGRVLDSGGRLLIVFLRR